MKALTLAILILIGTACTDPPPNQYIDNARIYLKNGQVISCTEVTHIYNSWECKNNDYTTIGAWPDAQVDHVTGTGGN